MEEAGDAPPDGWLAALRGAHNFAQRVHVELGRALAQRQEQVHGRFGVGQCAVVLGQWDAALDALEEAVATGQLDFDDDEGVWISLVWPDPNGTVIEIAREAWWWEWWLNSISV